MKHFACRSNIEPLEPRIAPAILVSPTTLTFDDQDGDHVTVKLSKPLLSSLVVANTVFKFDAGAVLAPSSGDATEQQLQLIDLDSLTATGVSITVSVVKAGQGDGYAAVGYIESTSDLDAVSIKGDLGGITAGATGTKTPGLKSLSVASIGLYGTATQSSASPSLASTITGALGSLTVTADVDDATITANGIGAVKIGGSLTGGAAAQSGGIFSGAGIGAVSIHGDVVGGTGSGSGDIVAAGAIASISIGGSLIGADGAGSTSASMQSGFIASGGNIGAVKIGVDMVAGHFDQSGKIFGGGSIASITVGGSLMGGDGNEDVAYTPPTTDVVFGVLPPAFGGAYGQIAVTGKVGALKIGGGLLGADGRGSASIEVTKGLGSISIGGDLDGGAGSGSASVTLYGKSGAISVGGSLIGDASATLAYSSADLYAVTSGPVKIGGSIIGGGSQSAGAIAGGLITSLIVGGSVAGGSGEYSGDIQVDTSIGSLRVGHELTGGSAMYAGSIFSIGKSLGPISIGGSIAGGSAAESGVVDSAAGISSLKVGGSIIAGTVADAGGVNAVTTIGSVLVKGSLTGAAGGEFAFIDALGSLAGIKSPKTDVAIKSVTIAGDSSYGEIVAGVDADELGVTAYENGSAQIGAVRIGGNFIGSNIVAGAAAGTNGFGSGATRLPTSDFGIYSTIASIAIGGQAIGTAIGDASGEIYGIVAQYLESIKIGASSIPLEKGPGNDLTAIPLGIAGGLNAYELTIAPI